jgi:hypothetical protein
VPGIAAAGYSPKNAKTALLTTQGRRAESSQSRYLGRLICLSTPYGKRGFLHDAWANGGDDWHRIEVPADHIGRPRT